LPPHFGDRESAKGGGEKSESSIGVRRQTDAWVGQSAEAAPNAVMSDDCQAAAAFAEEIA
jgi:hypothetical protein